MTDGLFRGRSFAFKRALQSLCFNAPQRPPNVPPMTLSTSHRVMLIAAMLGLATPAVVHAQSLISCYNLNGAYINPRPPSTGTLDARLSFTLTNAASVTGGSAISLCDANGGTNNAVRADGTADNVSSFTVQYSSTGLSGPTVSFDVSTVANGQSANRGFQSATASYSFDNVTYTPTGQAAVLFSGTDFQTKVFNLSGLGVLENKPVVYIRVNLSGASGNATTTFDNISVRANPVTTTATRALGVNGSNPSTAQGDGAGFRMLSSPIQGFGVQNLVNQNLVQGIPAGTTNPQQYPAFDDNIYVSYNAGSGPNGFIVPTTMDQTLPSGRGFFWYLFDNTYDPTAGGNTTGTSVSYELTGRNVTATGLTPVATFTNTFSDYIGAGTESRFYLAGNPFARPLSAAGVTSVPARQTNLQVWNPSGGTPGPGGAISGTYVLVGAAQYLAVWQGAFVEVSAAGPAAVTYNFHQTNASATPLFYGRTVDEGVAFKLTGTLSTGAQTVDEAAIVRVHPEASAGWDVHDATKLIPPTADYALVSPTIQRDGALYHTALSALPVDATTRVPVAFTATGAGTFTLSWTSTLDAGRSASLRDLVTGTVTSLDAGSYTFTAGATAWTERFEVEMGTVVASAATPTTGLHVGAVTPNPSVGTAALTVAADPAVTVTAELFDSLGRRVALLHEGLLLSAASLPLPVAGLPGGVYTVRVRAGEDTVSRRFTVIR